MHKNMSEYHMASRGFSVTAEFDILVVGICRLKCM